jgi:hypothetical protein
LKPTPETIKPRRTALQRELDAVDQIVTVLRQFTPEKRERILSASDLMLRHGKFDNNDQPLIA